MFVGKNSWEDADLLNPDAFEEIEYLLSEFHKITVTTSRNITYNTWDLCARGATPDSPGSPAACALLAAANPSDPSYQTLAQACFPSAYFPCLISAPQHCFNDSAPAFLHDGILAGSGSTMMPQMSYAQMMDPNIDMGPHQAILQMKPYTGARQRPSYRLLNEKQMKVEVSQMNSLTKTRGCPTFTKQVSWPVGSWGGSVTWNANYTLVEKVPALMWMFFMDGPARIKFRLSWTKPNHTNEGDILEAIGLHEEAWQRKVDSFSSSKLKSASFLHPTTFEDAVKDYEEDPAIMYALSFGLMAIFVWLSSLLQGFHSRPHVRRLRSLLAVLGLLCVMISAYAATGFSLMFGLKMNPIIMAVIPFLSLGLGVDDMFVLLNDFFRIHAEARSEDVIGEVMAQAGPGVLLTSACNTVAFACGSLLPIPAMSDFCKLASVVACLNCLVMLTMFVPLLALSLRCMAHSEARDASSENTPSKAVAFLNRWSMRPLMAFWPVALGLLVASILIISFEKDIGYSPSEGVKKDTSTHAAIELFFDKFNFFPAWLCFDDIDVPHHQEDMLKLYQDIVSSEFGLAYFIPPYLSLLYDYVWNVGQQPAAPGAPTLAELGLVPSLVEPSRNSTPLLFARNGIMDPSKPQQFHEEYAKWSALPNNSSAGLQLLAQWGGVPPPFAQFDQASTNEFAMQDGKLGFSFFPFFVTAKRGEMSQDDFVQAAEDMRRAVEDSPIKDHAFVHSWVSTFWSIFEDLESVLWRTVAISSSVIFMFTLLAGMACRPLSADSFVKEFLACVIVALVTTLACMMIVLEIFGISMLFLKFNIFVATTVLAAEGISVEFVAHLVTKFVTEQGTPQERLVRSVGQLAPAVIQGSLATFVAILPMVFSEYEFVVKYFFGIWTIVVAVGVLNGLVLLPAILGPIGFLFTSNASQLTETGQTVGKSETSLPHMLANKSSNHDQKPSEASV
jgi:patched 1 protein